MDKGNECIDETTIGSLENYGHSSTMNKQSDIHLSNYLDNDEKCYEQFIKEDIHQKDILQLSWKDLYPQVLASVVVYLLILQSGVNLAYSNVILHIFPTINKTQYSWLTSIVSLCMPLGSILICPIMERFGRKIACFCTCLPLLASWLLSVGMTLDNIIWFYVSRICAGIGCGMATAVIVYVSEIAHPTYKPLLLSFNSVFFSAGILLSSLLINFLGWKAITSTLVLLTVVNMALIVICVPESPLWIFKFKGPEYIIKGKRATKQIYPNNNRLFNAEWNRLKEMSADGNIYANDKSTQTFLLALRTSPAAYKPVIILVIMLTLQQCSGAYMIISYALPVFQSIVPGGSANKLEALALLGVIRFIGGIVTSLLSFYIGRRPLMVVSCLGMALSSAMVSLTVSSQQTPVVANLFGLTGLSVPLVGVVVFVLSSSIGVLVFPWTLTSELLPTSIMAVGSSSLVSYGCLIMFVTLRAFPYLLTSLGLANLFVGFGSVSLILAVFVLLYVPESKGKTLEQIEEYFLRK